MWWWGLAFLGGLGVVVLVARWVGLALARAAARWITERSKKRPACARCGSLMLVERAGFAIKILGFDEIDDGALGHGFECGACGTFLQAG